jgi:hypothetical protein
MKKLDRKLLNKNLKVDQKVVSEIAELEKRLPFSERKKQGSDYKISPPLGGHALSYNRQGKEI